MKLSEKIYYCRKKAGLSQDGLAEKLDVSRQAISKWENGEAMPETAKLPALAKVFGVSIDWLLSEAEPVDAEVKNTPEAGQEEAQTMSYTPPRIHSGNWQGIMGKLVRRWGWLAGIYVAVGGGGIAGIGILAKTAVSMMTKSFRSTVSSMTTELFPGGSVQILDENGNVLEGEMAEAVLEAVGGSSGWEAASPFGGLAEAPMQMLENNPVDIFANVLIVLGTVVLIGGIILAIWLRKWGSSDHTT